MKKYRKKPIVIKAGQFLYKDFGTYTATDIRASISMDNADNFIIETLEGNHFVTDGDYIIQGIRGELYPCKKDIFEETYEAV